VDRLTTDDLPRHVLIYGARGIGKTTLALAAAHKLIDLRRVQAVIWPENVEADQLARQIAAWLGVAHTDQISPRLQTIPTLIMLDCITGDLAKLPGILGAAQVILCADQASVADLAYVHVPDLDKESALSLLSREAKHRQRGEDLDLFSQLYYDFGGNPGALKSALLGGKHYDPATITAGIFPWEKRPTVERLIWLVLALSESRSYGDLYTLFPDSTQAKIDGALLNLQHESVIITDRWQQITLTPLARAFALQILRDGSARKLVQAAIRRIVTWALAGHTGRRRSICWLRCTTLIFQCKHGSIWPMRWLQL
jgi:hypothetical protein